MINRRLLNLFTLMAAMSAATPALALDDYVELRRAQAQVKRFPNNLQKRVDLACIYGRAGDREKAINQLKEIIALPGGNKPETYNRLSAEDIKAHPHDPQSLLTRSILTMHAKQYQQAIADCTEALKRLPPGETQLRAAAAGRRGRAYLCTEQWHKAILDYTIAIAADPAKGSCHTDRGFCLLKVGRAHEALADFQKSIDMMPDQKDAYLARANYYEDAHEYKKEIADLSAIIDKLHTRMNQKLFERRIRLYDLTGQKALAEKDRATLRDCGSVVDEVFKPLR
jgi:tetratricopeptide (TPR) repeat protein